MNNGIEDAYLAIEKTVYALELAGVDQIEVAAALMTLTGCVYTRALGKDGGVRMMKYCMAKLRAK